MAKLETLEDARKHRYGTWGGNPTGSPYTEGYCMASVFHDYHSWQCSNKIWRDGFCKQHHPETLKAKQEKADARWKAKQVIWDKERADAMENKRRLEDYDYLVDDFRTATGLIEQMKCRNIEVLGDVCCELKQDKAYADTKKCDVCRAKDVVKFIKERRNK
jgi:hypothetical protein